MIYLILCVNYLLSGPFSESENQGNVEIIKQKKKPSSKIDSSYYIFISSNFSHLFSPNDDIIFKTNDYIGYKSSNPNPEAIKNSIYYFEDSLISIKKASLPTDPLFSSEFNIKNQGNYDGFNDEDGNILDAWNQSFLGNGINLNVLDDGCYLDHYDFKDRVNSELNLNLYDKSNNVSPSYSYDSHGTACLGVAAASQNDYCGVGVAPNTTVSCHKYYSPKFTTSDFLKSLAKGIDEIDITSCSWGLNFDINDPDRKVFYFQGIDELSKSIESLLMKSRNGKERIVVFSGGNDGLTGVDTNSYLFNKDPNFIAASASNIKGGASYYSNPGNCIFINAPSSGNTMYFSKEDQYTSFPLIPSTSIGDSACTQIFSGTSASAPYVSGAIALILQANPNLTSRDVKFILALTSTINDYNHFSWHQNHAGYWYSPFYGFGRIDAGLATKTALNWKQVPKSTKIVIKNKGKNINKIPSIGDEKLKIAFQVDSSINFIESCLISFYSNTTDISMMKLELISPSNTKAIFKSISNYESNIDTSLKYTFTILDFFGESSKGEWILQVSNHQFNQNGQTLNNITLEIQGVVKEFKLPNVQRRKGKNSLLSNNKDELKITLKQDKITCNNKLNVNIKSTSEIIFSAGIRLMLMDEEYKNGLAAVYLSGIESLETDILLNIPCLFKDKTKLILKAEIPLTNISAIAKFKIINPHSKSEIISPKIYQVVNSGEKFKVKWSLSKERIINANWEQKVVIRLYNSSQRNLVYHDVFWNNGEANLNISKSFRCPECILTITPTLRNDLNECDSMIVPFKIIQPNEEEPANFIFNIFDQSHCYITKTYSDSHHHINSVLLTGIIISSIIFITLILFIIVLVKYRKTIYKKQNKFVKI